VSEESIDIEIKSEISEIPKVDSIGHNSPPREMNIWEEKKEVLKVMQVNKPDLSITQKDVKEVQII